jgi:polysaccharide export outer membrane protein
MTMRPTKSLALLVAAFVSTVVAVAAAGQAAGTQSPGATYTVGPSDVLKVLVFNEDQLSGSFRVEPDGSIVYAMLGRMHVAGRTEREIAALIEKELANGWLNKPQVAVQVEQFRSRTIFIAGEVRTPGKYPLQGDNTLLEVLALAGSITGNASNEVVIVRPKTADAKAMPTLPDSGAEAEVLRVDLQKIEQGFTSSNILLQDGDTVFVPRAEKFYISGHVRSPGAYAYNKGMTIQQAIAVAGEYVEIDVRLSDQIRPNDTIIVRQRYI